MEEIAITLRQIPHVKSVTVLSQDVGHLGIDYSDLERLMDKKKKVSLIGKTGCAVFFSTKSNIMLIQSDAKVNLGAIDLILDSIK